MYLYKLASEIVYLTASKTDQTHRESLYSGYITISLGWIPQSVNIFLLAVHNI